jgi:subtilisin family serine protease
MAGAPRVLDRGTLLLLTAVAVGAAVVRLTGADLTLCGGDAGGLSRIAAVLDARAAQDDTGAWHVMFRLATGLGAGGERALYIANVVVGALGVFAAGGAAGALAGRRAAAVGAAVVVALWPPHVRLSACESPEPAALLWLAGALWAALSAARAGGVAGHAAMAAATLLALDASPAAFVAPAVAALAWLLGAPGPGARLRGRAPWLAVATIAAGVAILALRRGVPSVALLGDDAVLDPRVAAPVLWLAGVVGGVWAWLFARRAALIVTGLCVLATVTAGPPDVTWIPWSLRPAPLLALALLAGFGVAATDDVAARAFGPGRVVRAVVAGVWLAAVAAGAARRDEGVGRRFQPQEEHDARRAGTAPLPRRFVLVELPGQVTPRFLLDHAGLTYRLVSSDGDLWGGADPGVPRVYWRGVADAGTPALAALQRHTAERRLFVRHVTTPALGAAPGSAPGPEIGYFRLLPRGSALFR